MRRRTARVAVLVLLVVVAAGCKRKPDKRARCQKVMTRMVGGVAAGLMMGLGDQDDPETKCFARNIDDPAKCMPADEAADFRAKLAVEVDKCMAWTDQQIGCFERFDDSPACEHAFAAMQGLKVSEVKGEGPAPAWQLAVDLPAADGKPGSIDAIHPADGTVIVVSGDVLIAVADGAERWRATVPGLGPIAAGPCLAVAGDEGPRCFDPATGVLVWQTPLPTEEDPDWEVLAWRDQRLILIDDTGGVAVADPAACKTRSPACLVARPPLEGAYQGWSMTRGVAVRPDGGWIYADDRLVALVGPDDVAIARFTVRGGEGYVTDPAVTPSGAGIVGWERSIHRLDPAACASPDLIDPAAAPAGCITVIADRGADAGDGWAPRPLGENDVAFSSGNELHVYRAGKKAFATELSFGLTLAAGDPDVIFTGGAGLGGFDLPPEVRAVSLTDGATRWRTKLPSLGSSGLGGPLFTGDARFLYIASRTTVAALPR